MTKSTIDDELGDFQWIEKRYIVGVLLIVLFILLPLINGLPLWRWQIEAGNFINLIMNQWWLKLLFVRYILILVKEEIEFRRGYIQPEKQLEEYQMERILEIRQKAKSFVEQHGRNW